MAEVKWIKITTDIFDDEKILLIESLPEADSIIVIWFKLLCLAGKQNNSGVFMLGDKIPYTEKMLATIFRRKESTVQLALNTFQQFGMIEIIDGVITIPNWGKHQSLDQIENKKQYMKNYMKEYREKQKQISSCSKTNCKTNSKSNVRQAEEEIEEEIEIEIEKEIEEYNAPQAGAPSRKSPIDYDIFKDTYNTVCTNLSKVKLLSEKRKENIRKFLKQLTFEDFKTACEVANTLDFTTGKNDRGWKADFDFIITVDKALRLLEGKYEKGENNAGVEHDTKPKYSIGTLL